MKISIIVPAFNEEQFLGETLAQIKAAAGAFANAGWETELIVCDNNSTDRTAEIARAAGANVVFEPVNQISRARNSGAAAATGDWLVFVDADSHPSAGVFADMAKEIQTGNCIAGGATIRWDQKLFIMELLTPLVNLGWEIELIVCDNHSTDHTAEIARAAGAKVVFEPVNQISRARNAGAAAATGDWLVFVDADSRPTEALIREVAGEIQSGNCIAGGATVRWDERHFVFDLLTPMVNVGFRWRRLLVGAFMFVETAAFQKLGGFSLEAWGGEDLEISRRLKKLAKETGKQFVILRQHPIVTSGRKLKQLTIFTPFRMVWHILFYPHRFTASRAAARYWYDVRR